MSSMGNEGRRLTYKELVVQVREWNVEFRLKEKYHTWRLKYALPKVSAAFYKLVEHSLISYVLGNLGWLVKASEEEAQAQLSGMKTAYSEMNLASSISSEIFNFWMVLLVKLASYFLSNHVAAVLVDTALECDIYRHTMLHVLGIQMEKNTYRILLRMFGSKREASKERKSIKLAEREKDGAEEKENQAKKTIQSIGRRNGKHETTFFSNLASFNEERSRLEEIKHLLKSNLYVKPIPRKVQTKYSIGELKQQNCKQHCSLEGRATPTGKFTIQANQLSHAFASNYALRLNEIKNHSIHCSHTKPLPQKPNSRPPAKRLQIKREEEEEAKPEAKVGKPSKNWVKIVTEMKEQLYQHKESRLSEQAGAEGRREDRECQLEAEQGEMIAEEEGREKWQPTEEVFRFRKLNLMNSPNIIVYEDCPIDLNQDEPHNNDLKSLKMNRSRLEKAERRRNNQHLLS